MTTCTCVPPVSLGLRRFCGGRPRDNGGTAKGVGSHALGSPSGVPWSPHAFAAAGQGTTEGLPRAWDPTPLAVPPVSLGLRTLLRRQAKGHRRDCQGRGIPRPWQSLRCPLVSARFCGGRPRDNGGTAKGVGSHALGSPSGVPWSPHAFAAETKGHRRDARARCHSLTALAFCVAGDQGTTEGLPRAYGSVRPWQSTSGVPWSPHAFAAAGQGTTEGLPRAWDPYARGSPHPVSLGLRTQNACAVRE